MSGSGIYPKGARRSSGIGSAIPLPTAYPPIFGGDVDIKANDPASQAAVQFGTRFGINQYAKSTNQLAVALLNPAKQLQEVNTALMGINSDLSKEYITYVEALRGQFLPEEVVLEKADSYIKPIIAARMDILKLQFPYAFGGGSPEFNPLVGIAEGRGAAEGAFQAHKQFQNYRELKKAFKAQKKARKAGK